MVRKYRIGDAAATPMITLEANDNWLEYTLRYVVDYRRRRATKNALFSLLMDLTDSTRIRDVRSGSCAADQRTLQPGRRTGPDFQLTRDPSSRRFRQCGYTSPLAESDRP